MTPSSLNRYPDQSRTDDWIVAALVVVGVLAVLGLGLLGYLAHKVTQGGW